jgi:fructokinase
MRIGIDLGGTKIAAAALDPGGAELARRRVATPRDDYEATLGAIVGLVGDLEQATGQRGTVGVGMPGGLSLRTGLVKNANSTWLNGRRFDIDLAAALGREVRCTNDANCLVLSEATDGAGSGAALVFAVILGTGVGAGLAVNGKVAAGRNGVGGEWGHNPLPWPEPGELPGPACWCGQRGCIETWLSGPALAREGEDVDRYTSRLARALAHVVNIVDPDVIVVGGGLSALDQIYRDVPPQLPRWVFGGEVDTPVRRAVHGPDSGVRGAAWLWPAC